MNEEELVREMGYHRPLECNPLGLWTRDGQRWKTVAEILYTRLLVRDGDFVVLCDGWESARHWVQEVLRRGRIPQIERIGEFYDADAQGRNRGIGTDPATQGESHS